VGDAVNTTARTVMVLAKGADAEEAAQNAQAAVDAIVIHTQPLDAAETG
jgi:phosphoribosylamine-glycine ligase